MAEFYTVLVPMPAKAQNCFKKKGGMKNEGPGLESLFFSAPLKTKKHKNYFPIYEELLKDYVGRDLQLLDIGALDGGSLLLWKRFLGDNATIIGADVNPRVLELSSTEFRLEVGSQDDPSFWKTL